MQAQILNQTSKKITAMVLRLDPYSLNPPPPQTVMVKSKSTTKASVSKPKASQKPWVRKTCGPTKRGFHTQKHRVSDESDVERPEAELKESRPRKKVKHTEVNVDDEDEDEVV